MCYFPVQLNLILILVEHNQFLKIASVCSVCGAARSSFKHKLSSFLKGGPLKHRRRSNGRITSPRTRSYNISQRPKSEKLDMITSELKRLHLSKGHNEASPASKGTKNQFAKLSLKVQIILVYFVFTSRKSKLVYVSFLYHENCCLHNRHTCIHTQTVSNKFFLPYTIILSCAGHHICIYVCIHH